MLTSKGVTATQWCADRLLKLGHDDEGDVHNITFSAVEPFCPSHTVVSFQEVVAVATTEAAAAVAEAPSYPRRL